MPTNEEFKQTALWALSERTGLSSRCMAAHLLGAPCDGSYPSDGGDFGRCEALLEAVPSFRGRISEMASVNAYWAALAPRWEDIRAAPDKYKLIQEIVRPVEDADPRHVRFGNGVSLRF